MMKFQYPARLNLAHLPTPIQKLNKFSDRKSYPEIYIKRDDLTGIALSGNKIRKLEFVAAEAQSIGADVLITCGGVQSNHARATAIVATQLGMKSFLVLRGQETSDIDGNLFLDRLVGAEIIFITPEQYSNQRNEIMEELAEELRSKHHKPYVIPEGASNALGSMGYLAGTEEILTQLKSLHMNIDAIICADGSGGTHAGLIMGKKLYNQSYDVYGINVCDNEEYFINQISHILDNANDRFNLNIRFTPKDIHVIDGYVGEGYALNRPEEIDLIKNCASTEGLILDPVYTVKAMHGLLDQIEKGRFKKGENILFLHSGGIFGLFPKRELFY